MNNQRIVDALEQLAIEHPELRIGMLVGRSDAFSHKLFDYVTGYPSSRMMAWSKLLAARERGEKVILPFVARIGTDCGTAALPLLPRELGGHHVDLCISTDASKDTVEVFIISGKREAIVSFKRMADALTQALAKAEPRLREYVSQLPTPAAGLIKWAASGESSPAKRFKWAWCPQDSRRTLRVNFPKMEGSDAKAVARRFEDIIPPWMVPCDGWVIDGKSAFEFLAGLVAGDRPLPWDHATEERNCWVYEKYMAKTPQKQIVSELERIAKDRGWEPISTGNGVKKATNRYAEVHGRPRPAKRKSGRKSVTN